MCFASTCRSARAFQVFSLLLLTLVPIVSSAGESKAERMKRWTHFSVAKALPGSAWGTGGIGVADFDRDGHIDLAISRRETKTAYWFSRNDDATWVRHQIATEDHLERTLGAAALDMDQDGWVDVAFWGVWFKNPGKDALPDATWKAFPYEGGGHDVIAADVSGDGKPDLVTYDGHIVRWFDPAKKLRMVTVLEGREDHGGIAHRGVGDLDADGDIDIVSKVWNADGPTYHVDYWRNDIGA